MQRKPKDKSLCEVSGCKNKATWNAHKLWGKGGLIRVCEECKPDNSKRPESIKHLPSYYRLEPIQK